MGNPIVAEEVGVQKREHLWCAERMFAGDDDAVPGKSVDKNHRTANSISRKSVVQHGDINVYGLPWTSVHRESLECLRNLRASFAELTRRARFDVVDNVSVHARPIKGLFEDWCDLVRAHVSQGGMEMSNNVLAQLRTVGNFHPVGGRVNKAILLMRKTRIVRGQSSKAFHVRQVSSRKGL
jgi:hypothetical protein